MADYMQAPRRNALLGVLADATRAVDDYAQRPDSTMPMGKANALLSVLSRFAGVPAVASTLDRLSYGDSLTTGTGQTLRVRPEVVEAAMAAAPVVSAAGRVAGRGANALADASVRAITGNPQATAVNALAYARDMAPVNPLTVWHGSPHKFDKFDASKIGTGEGAQAYGHGIYVAESPDVASAYRASVVPVGQQQFGLDDGPIKGIATLIAARGNAGEAMARRAYAGQVPDIDAAITKAKQAIDAQSNLYKVDLPDEVIAKMLDWDKPLSQQSPEVQKAASMFGPNVGDLSGQELYKKASGFDEMVNVAAKANGDASVLRLIFPDATDAEIARAIASSKSATRNDAIASRILRDAGIPGIRYLDGGSRGAGGGTSNFVVFPGEENALTILERNGKPVR